MGDKITDLSEKSEVPPVPLKTYQWEDIRRQKIEGRYPWTHLYKPQFDKEKQVESKEHEYEPVMPMNAVKNTSPLPTLKITADKEVCTNAEPESPDLVQDKRHLCIPDNDDDNDESDESDGEDDSDEITAEELQQRLEERYFKDSTLLFTKESCGGGGGGEHELSRTRSLSPTLGSSHSHAKSDSSLSFHDRVQTRAVKLKRRLKSFKDRHISSKERPAAPVEGTPRMKRRMSDGTKKAKPAKKNKFNFRKRKVVKSQVEETRSASSECSSGSVRSPHPRRRRFSLPRLPSFSRSRSNSVKESGEGKSDRSRSSDAGSRKFFSYPRMFNACKSKKKPAEEAPKLAAVGGAGHKAKARSAPSTPSTRRQSPFPQRWVSKFIDYKIKEEKPKSAATGVAAATERDKESAKKGVVAESIFISLHEDSARSAREKEGERTEEEEKPLEGERAIDDGVEGEAPPQPQSSTKMKIDNKNFIFISLHEERFPEKLKQLGEENQENEILAEEREIEKELQQARTARKFHIMLKRIQNDSRMRRACRAEETADDDDDDDDDKPEPVLITEVTDDCADHQSNANSSYDIEQPKDICTPSSSENHECRENSDERGEIESTSKGAVFRQRRSDELSDDGDSSLSTRAPNLNPRKMPRQRKVKNTHPAADESRESIAAAVASLEEDDVFTLDNQRGQGGACVPETMMKTYIKADLERTVVAKDEHDHTTRHFVEYEKALQKSRSQSSFEIVNNYYSNTNSLVRMETPVPPARPSRIGAGAGTLTKKTRRAEMSSPISQRKENYYDLDANANYHHTFPTVSAKPDKPRRRFREKRAYSNSTTTTETTRNVDELEDDAINSNIVNSKQLSVSVLPLSSNVVGEPIIDYNLRETSSMIHLNLPADPPLPPKRRKSRPHCSDTARFSSLPNRRYHSPSKGSITPLENINNLTAYRIDGEIEYADDASSGGGGGGGGPKRPHRRRNTWLPDDDGGLWREMQYSSSGKLFENQRDDRGEDRTDSRTVNEYAVIQVPKLRRESKIDSTMSMPRRISRRVSDFFTIPRLRPPMNYVSPCSQTLDNRRFPSPSRPPRRNRRSRPPANRDEHVYLNDESAKWRDSNGDEEQLDFRLATERETPERDEEVKDDWKNLETRDIFERMKSRPLPPPPRPTRKPKEDDGGDYSECVKRKKKKTKKEPVDDDATRENNLSGREVVETGGVRPYTTSSRSMWNSWERRTTVREFEISPNGERREILTRVSQSEERASAATLMAGDHDSLMPTTNATQSSLSDTNDDGGSLESTTSTRHPCDRNDELQARRSSIGDSSIHTSFLPQSKEICPVSDKNDFRLAEDSVHTITAARLNVSELNVGRMNVDEIDSSRLVTSYVESSSMQVLSDVRTETGHVIVNSINCSDCMSAPPERCPLLEATTTARETTLAAAAAASYSEDVESAAETASVRSRISSMVPEIGSEDECGGNAASVKVRRPTRRKHQASKRDEVQHQASSARVQPAPAEANHATLAELMSQILRICYSSVGEALNSLFESVIPEDREKRSEVQAAIWVITIIVAGCLMLGLQSNEKVVHHHHWDFHFPPPH